MKLTFYDFMRAGHVKRWHIVETVRPQTLAEHLWRVTVIALELYQLMGHDAANERAQLMAAALFHDTPEIRMGDTPTPAKAFIRERAGVGDMFKLMEEELMPEIPYIGGALPPELARFLKMADAIEAAHWISEHAVGAHGQVVAQYNKKLMGDLVVRFTNETGQDWFKAVNEVLMALGMPYLSSALRMTPP